jgi:hypothetical protein
MEASLIAALVEQQREWNFERLRHLRRVQPQVKRRRQQPHNGRDGKARHRLIRAGPADERHPLR